MLKSLQRNKVRVLLGLAFVLLFSMVRAYEDQLFYDPFLNYFKSNYNDLSLPSYDTLRLILGLMFRYGLNTVLSLALIYVLFKDVAMVKFATFLYIFFFFCLIAAFFAVIYWYGANNNLMLFYVRRFLIQPIFVILFIPAFYYQKLHK